jgi:hypothetical protein
LSEARGLEPPTPVSVLLPLRGEVHVVIEAIEVHELASARGTPDQGRGRAASMVGVWSMGAIVGGERERRLDPA